MTSLKIRLESFTPILLQKNVIHLNTIKRGIFLPLPTRKKKITVLRSPHIDKKSREQFELNTHAGYLVLDTSKDDNQATTLMLATLRKHIFSGVRCTIKKECQLFI